MRRSELLPPELLDGLRDLDWVARMVARGLDPGLHRSPFAGMGEDFERHRPYQQGDDLRHLDWRVMARADRLHVRRYRETTHLKAMVVVDASASMDFAGESGVSKARFAILLAASLGHLMHMGGDHPGLGVLDSGGSRLAASPTGGREGRGRFLHALEGVAPGGSGSLAPLVARAGGQLRGRGRLVVLSDFLEDDEGEALVVAMGQSASAGHEVTAVRILTPEELGARGGGEGLYLDPEAPSRRIPGAPSRDREYQRRLEAYYQRLRREARRKGVAWREARTDDPLLPLIRRWVRESARP
ncbi:MAG: DUF58 domain-containing protein [Gemmatimonadales bacterium]|nr:MAG: DUF58 domain-containing protein [Gemmatimonadales bacterium]